MEWSFLRVVAYALIASASLASNPAIAPAQRPGEATKATTPNTEVTADQSNDRTPRPKVTISKETTYITEPLRPDGYPDYRRYVDEKISRDVNQDNNAAVLLLRALGPAEIPDELRTEFFKRLGIEPLPVDGDYLVDWTAYSKRFPAKEWPPVPADRHVTPQEYFEALDDAARRRPWKRDDFPAVAKWLEAYDGQIDLLVAASRKPKMYAPVMMGEEHKMLVAAPLPLVQRGRQAVRVLTTRAMYRAGAGDVDSAIDDLMACHRLARLTNEGFTLLEGLVAVAMNQMALDAEKTLISHDVLTAKQRTRLRTSLDQLPTLRRMADLLDQGERLVYLDSVCTMSRGVTEIIRDDTDDGPSAAMARVLLEQTLGSAIDWDIPLKAGNDWYDRLVEIGRVENRKEQLQRLQVLQDDIKALAQSAKSPKLVISALLAPRATASQQISNALISLFLPAMDAAFTAERRNGTNQSLVVIGLALAEYRDEHKQFPQRLDQLVPRHLDKIPLDPMWGDAFTYRKTDAGYLLYAPGQNGQDDGGQTAEDKDGSDDLVIRVPANR